MARLAGVAWRPARRREYLRRLNGAGPHETLDRGIRETVALPAGQVAPPDERRRRGTAEPGSKQKAGDRLGQDVHARTDQRVRTSTSPSTPVMTLNSRS